MRLAGRSSGTLNATTLGSLAQVTAICAKRKFDPIEFMILVAQNNRKALKLGKQRVDIKTRARCAMEIAHYRYTQLARTEIADPSGRGVGETFAEAMAELVK